VYRSINDRTVILKTLHEEINVDVQEKFHTYKAGGFEH
jgi:hypothetical protein